MFGYLGRLVVRRVVYLVVGLLFGMAVHQCAHALPAGAVIPFNLASCPAGWTAVSSLAGRVVVGVGTLGSDTYSLAGTGGEARHTLTTAELPSHSHQFAPHGGDAPFGYPGSTESAGYLAFYGGGAAGPFYDYATATQSTGSGTAHENRPPYLALLYCSLDADEIADTGTAPAQAVFVGGMLVLFAVGFLTGQKA